jgi:predicted protein tyrosine phosphatase
MQPIYRSGTKKAIDELAVALHLPNDSDIQDWSYTQGNPADIEKYIAHYDLANDDDQKFVLMQLIIQAIEDQSTEDLFLKYWERIPPILATDFELHAYTIHYWACVDYKNLDKYWKTTPLMRQVWANKHKLKILFVCTINRMRSATAHKIYENDQRFEVKSAGTDPSANVVLSLDILNWADSIIVMEKHHRNVIRNRFSSIYKNKKIVCLYIPDEYDYMQIELIDILKGKVEDVYRRKLI